MQLFPIDTHREVLVAETDTAAITFAAVRFLSIAQRAIAEHNSFSVALSGGSTPKKLYEYLLHSERAKEIDWSHVNLFWSDERAVPPDDPQSNYKMAMHYFSQPPLNAAKVFRMEAEDSDREQAALDYEHLIRTHCFEERLDLVLLGIGDDCHTASLFPGTKALFVEDHLVTPSIFPEKKSHRMTLTFRCINEARKILVLAFGKEKGKALQTVFFGKKDPEKCPAQLIGDNNIPVLFIIDSIAAAEINQNAKSPTEESLF